MRLFARFWATLISVTDWITISPLNSFESHQQPIGGKSQSLIDLSNAKAPRQVFRPGGSNIDGFQCDYSAMGPNWVDCTSTAGCWLRNTVTRQVLDVNTDYENVLFTPTGITRNYTLYVTEGNTINADGLKFTDGRTFNGIFPGPLLEACWGDTINVTVVNKMIFNGTSIHWHGIRQLNTTHMDGVNGITQCPIAPGDTFSYVWRAMQYGSSWYHSHYSVQYADGLQGPITLHGPTTMAYDTAVAPLITSDWLHNSAFQAQFGKVVAPTILLNGTGNVTRFYGANTPSNPGGINSTIIPKGFELTFNATKPNGQTGARRYLLRIINTSYSTQITFSIDNHYLVVVEADFVPVAPKNVTSILVAIGQRYHVIVEAKPATLGAVNPIEPFGNYWIRTNTSSCFDDFNGNITGFERTGILRYTNCTSDPRNPACNMEPQSNTWPEIATLPPCYDGLTSTLQTVYNWNVTAPKNGLTGSLGFGGELFNIDFNNKNVNTPPYSAAFFNFQRTAEADFTPFQTTYGNPTFLNLANVAETWPVGWVVVSENFTSNDFVYLVLQGGGHPIHLHGHDFAILESNANATFKTPHNWTAPYFGPMRRDVVLVPPNGYAVIAFKTDNPGSWLMHCHIAFHASGGLSLQIMERQADASAIWPPGQSPALSRANRLCSNWNSWVYDCRNYWPGNVTPGKVGLGAYPACDNATILQNDSGV